MNEHDFGRRLRDLRHDRGETLEHVSAATGLSIAMLSRVERGERLPSPESVEALAAHFGLPVDDLMSETIATRMLNRYGRASSNKAAERMQGPPPAYALHEQWAEDDGLIRSASMMPPLASAPPPPASAAPAMGVGFTRRPIEDLFPRDSALGALEDATRVAEVAVESAVAAAERAIASGDPMLEAEGRAALARLRRRLKER